MTNRSLFQLLPLTLLAAACSGTQGDGAADVTPDQSVAEVHILPVASPDDALDTAAAARTPPHLSYSGGRVVSNMQVVEVLWGGTGPGTGDGQFLDQLWSTSSPSVATFYQGVLNSPYVDWLAEYDTNLPGAGGKPGTNQTIGHGAFTGQYHIVPADPTTAVDGASIPAELQNQIAAGKLPAPTKDAQGNNNTYYAVFFPHGTTIGSKGVVGSCRRYCAYHSAVAAKTVGGVQVPEFYYGVQPDFQAGSGCERGCGGSTVFNNTTAVASHEMVETLTDGETSLGTAWYDPSNGEIGDICVQQQDQVVGGDGVTYTVQKEWSNQANACITTKGNQPPPPPPANQFSLALSPSTGILAAGAQLALTVQTAVVSGSAETVALAVSGLPAGVIGTFSPASVKAGASAQLLLSATAQAASATVTATVTGAAASATHSATLALTVKGTVTPPPPTTGGIVDGDFESGLTGWTVTGTASAAAPAHSGAHGLLLGADASGESSASQTFTVADKTRLVFFQSGTCAAGQAGDWSSVELQDRTAGWWAVISKGCHGPAWNELISFLTKGHRYTVTFTNHGKAQASFDDVTLQ